MSVVIDFKESNAWNPYMLFLIEVYLVNEMHEIKSKDSIMP